MREESARPEPRVRVGRIVRPHGLGGEVLVRAKRISAEQFAALGAVHLVRDRVPGERRARIEGARGAENQLLVRFEGVATPEAAAELRGAWVEAERDAMPDAGDGRIYHFDLLGLEVYDERDRRLGVVRAVIPTGANEVLEIETGSEDLLLPYHPGTVLGWDRDRRRLFVRLPEGLEEIYRPSSDRALANPEDSSSR